MGYVNIAADYTEVDPNGRITLATVRATGTAIQRDESAYVYKDWGAGHFGDFIHDFEIVANYMQTGKVLVWGMSNTVGSKNAWTEGIYFYLEGNNTWYHLSKLGEVGVGESSGDNGMWWQNKRYFRVKRIGTTLSIKGYESAANRSLDVSSDINETLTVATTTYRYHYVLSSISEGNTAAQTVYVENIMGSGFGVTGTPFTTEYAIGLTEGDWDDGATWGCAGSTKGVDYPGSAADVVMIGAGVTINYNVSETNKLGDITIYGTLSFKPDINTKLVLGNNNIFVKGGGSLLIGTDALPIEVDHTAELYFDTTGDQDKGVIVGTANTTPATFRMVGSDTTGGVLQTYLVSNWTTGKTLTIKGDVTDKWTPGSIIALHRFPTTTTGMGVNSYTINTLSANGDDTDIAIVESAPGVTFRAGAVVVHAGYRNVRFGKLGATQGANAYNSARPRVLTYNVAAADIVPSDTKLSFSHAQWVGVYYCPWTEGNPAKFNMYNCVVSNGYYGGSNAVTNGTFEKVLYLSHQVFAPGYGNKFINCVMMNMGSPFEGGSFNEFTDCYFIEYAGSSYPLIGPVNTTSYNRCYFMEGLRFCCASYARKVIFRNCGFGKFSHHANYTQPYDFIMYTADGDDVSFFNCVFPPDGITLGEGYIRQGGNKNWIYKSSDHNGVAGSNLVYSTFYSSKNNSSVVRDGGSTESLELFYLNYCTSMGLKVPIFEWIEWDVPASEQTRQIYIRGGNGGAENWATYPTAAELYMEVEYYDAETMNKAFAVSTAVLTDNTTWTAFPVTFVPGRVGHAIYRLRLGLNVGIASKKLYVDAQLEAT